MDVKGIHFLIIISLIVFTSCDTRRNRRRRIIKEDSALSAGNLYRSTWQDDPSKLGQPINDGANSNDKAVTFDSFPSDFKECRTDFAFNQMPTYNYGEVVTNSFIGPYNICKNAANDVLIQLMHPLENAVGVPIKLCLNPIETKAEQGKYISLALSTGSFCDLITKADGFYKFSFGALEQPGNHSVTGVVITKDEQHYFGPAIGTTTPEGAFFACFAKQSNRDYQKLKCTEFNNTKGVKYIRHDFINFIPL